MMLDGYDEYEPGTNKNIDKAIQCTIGNCFLILTSRQGSYLSKRIRDTMDGEILIEGFSEESILECSTKYLGSKEKSQAMLKQAKQAGIYTLLHIPIILVVTVVVFTEEQSLPKTKTDIYKTIFRLVMDRTTLKTFGCRSEHIAKLAELLDTLGEFSWTALQNDVQQLLLKRVTPFHRSKQDWTFFFTTGIECVCTLENIPCQWLAPNYQIEIWDKKRKHSNKSRNISENEKWYLLVTTSKSITSSVFL